MITTEPPPARVTSRAGERELHVNLDLEERVAARTAELAALNAELESFTYSVSHDLRAPLRHILGFAKILAENSGDRLDPEARHCLDRISEGAAHMSRLIDDLLNLSRVGRRELAVEPTDLAAVVKRVVASLAPETAGRRVDWRIGALPTIDCDPGLAEILFTNLLSNAVKYTRPRAHAVIEVGIARQYGEDMLFVRDDGVGFDMQYVDKLFGVFQRLHTAREFEGTGIGLATVARIVRKHGGRIWGSAAVDQGATFHFTLGPRRPPEPAASEAAGATPETAAA